MPCAFYKESLCVFDRVDIGPRFVARDAGDALELQYSLSGQPRCADPIRDRALLDAHLPGNLRLTTIDIFAAFYDGVALLLFLTFGHRPGTIPKYGYKG